MAIGYYAEDGRLVVFTEWDELAPPKGRRWATSRSYWALAAFEQLAEPGGVACEYPLNCYVFTADLEPAIRRILGKRRQQFTLLSQTAVRARVDRRLAGGLANINEAD